MEFDFVAFGTELGKLIKEKVAPLERRISEMEKRLDEAYDVDISAIAREVFGEDAGD